MFANTQIFEINTQIAKYLNNEIKQINMEYHGKLYGKVGNKFFDTGRSSDDYATLKQRHDEAMELLGIFSDFPEEDFKEINDSEYFTLSVPIKIIVDTKTLINKNKQK